VKYTVLIADDSKLQRVILKENLKDIYDVAEASCGQECLDLVENSEGKIDVVLLDIVMPGMDGFEVLRKRQRSEIFKNIPVIVLTMKEDQELAEQLGADGFLLKPVNLKDAHFRIRQVLGE
jgi:CheY-like chemotaxis protein